MSTSIFLATVIGWYLVIFSSCLLLKFDHIKSVVSEVTGQRGLFFILAIITVILGLLMVVSHNIWVMNWTLVITLFSWLVLISGLFRVFFPEIAVKMSKRFLKHDNGARITAVVLLIIGVFLLYHIYVV